VRYGSRVAAIVVYLYSGQFLSGQRTLAGAEQFCAIRSYLATAAKPGIHFFDALVMLAEGHPWLPEDA
jgi:hypothetical protein